MLPQLDLSVVAPLSRAHTPALRRVDGREACVVVCCSRAPYVYSWAAIRAQLKSPATLANATLDIRDIRAQTLTTQMSQTGQSPLNTTNTTFALVQL